MNQMNEAFEAGKKAFDNQNYKQAFELLLPVVEKGHPFAQYLVGKIYYAGLGIEQNLKQAALCFVRSAASQMAQPQHELAMMYELAITLRKI
jgi:uncharacterized protein